MSTEISDKVLEILRMGDAGNAILIVLLLVLIGFSVLIGFLKGWKGLVVKITVVVMFGLILGLILNAALNNTIYNVIIDNVKDGMRDDQKAIFPVIESSYRDWIKGIIALFIFLAAFVISHLIGFILWLSLSPVWKKLQKKIDEKVKIKKVFVKLICAPIYAGFATIGTLMLVNVFTLGQKIEKDPVTKDKTDGYYKFWNAMAKMVTFGQGSSPYGLAQELNDYMKKAELLNSSNATPEEKAGFIKEVAKSVNIDRVVEEVVVKNLDQESKNVEMYKEDEAQRLEQTNPEQAQAIRNDIATKNKIEEISKQTVINKEEVKQEIEKIQDPEIKKAALTSFTVNTISNNLKGELNEIKDAVLDSFSAEELTSLVNSAQNQEISDDAQEKAEKIESVLREKTKDLDPEKVANVENVLALVEENSQDIDYQKILKLVIPI
ncbi:hypothetical protein [Mycoplasma sp. Ms02]|uniref:hypothetical protein n=1 Tax=Mycoplasma sp. Ms02 TaxID=353851 RepID=UPI001C8916E0|nr:hypothetical protein [Mycoplasma sp. Ms02]QZE12670.1 hypothetical protein K4L35_01655 [Mycoplasma sp. Ms02]